MRLALVVILAAMLVVGLLSCQSYDNNPGQELWELLIEYTLEIGLVDQICVEELERAEEAMRSGEIDMQQLGQRFDEAYIIQANTIKFIDKNPKYALLQKFLWEEHEPPLMYLGPEWSPSLYVDEYISLHHSAIRELTEWLEEKADEMDIDLDYVPEWLE